MNLRRLYAHAVSTIYPKQCAPRIIAFVNQAAKSGKYVTTTNAGYGLALLGKKVLMIDLSLHTQEKCSLGLSSYFALTMGRTQVVPFLDENLPAGALELIPGDEKLLGLERETEKRIDKEFLLAKYLADIMTPYDYILINCPSSLCVRTINALAIAEEVIIPVKAAQQDAHTLSLLLETISLVKDQHNPGLALTGVLAIGNNRDVASFLKRAKCRRLAIPMLETQVREDVALFKTFSPDKILLAEHPDSIVSLDYLEFVKRTFSLARSDTPSGQRPTPLLPN